MNHGSMAAYSRLADHYAFMAGLDYATVWAAGFTAAGAATLFIPDAGIGSLTVAPNRLYVATGIAPSASGVDQSIVAFDVAGHSIVVPTNAGGSPRTDYLSIPATNLGIFSTGGTASRVFEDAITDVPSIQTTDTLKVWSVANLTYTVGGALPAGHVELVRYTVGAGSNVPVYNRQQCLPMGARKRISVFGTDCTYDTTQWDRVTDTTIVATAGSTAVIRAEIPRYAFVKSAQLRFTTGAAGGTFYGQGYAPDFVLQTAISVGSAWDTQTAMPVTLPVSTTAGTATIANIVWTHNYALKVLANASGVQVHGLRIDYLEW